MLRLSNYCMHRNGESRYLHAYFASPSGDADDVKLQIYRSLSIDIKLLFFAIIPLL
jgi:hypothetical protein